MRWDFVEDASQNPLLQLPQRLLGGFNQADFARFLRQDSVVIMPELGTIGFVAESFQVGKPFKVAKVDSEPLS